MSQGVSASSLMSMQDAATSSKVIGPGTWFLLHTLSLEADETNDSETINHLIFLINFIARRFKANDCREHFAKFVKDNPLHQHRCFEWTVDAHNSVNARQGKSILNVEDARDIWSPANIKITPCSEHAAASNPAVAVVPPITSYIPTPSSSIRGVLMTAFNTRR